MSDNWEQRLYITFPALSHVLQAEKLLAEEKVQFMVAPVPREISADCGMCIMCRPVNQAQIMGILDKKNIECENSFILRKKKIGFFRQEGI